MRIPFVLILTHPEFLRYYRTGSQDRLTKYGRGEIRRPNEMSSHRHERQRPQQTSGLNNNGFAFSRRDKKCWFSVESEARGL